MSRLTELIAEAKRKDPQLGADLEEEYKALASRRAFGLNFERHRPESVELPGRPVRRGDKVRILPPRGTTKKGDQCLWIVRSVEDGDAHLVSMDESGKEAIAQALDLVVVAEFRDPIFPGLVSTGKVERGNDKPYHIVINGENYHALKALTYTHRGKVDVIYIDPPYNSRARDWKYNNDYVDNDDLYRHSKWLAMMERRLLIARDLLNPESSVLIVTIDEKEYQRLGLLLEQVFPEATFQMISAVIAPQGSQRPGRFSRIEEHIFIGFFGEAQAIPSGDPMIATTDDAELEEPGAEEEIDSSVTWDSLIRRGTDATRQSREDMFYPIIIDKETRLVIDVGQPLGSGVPLPSDVGEGPDQLVKWPIRSDGSEGRWQLGRDTFLSVLNAGMARVGKSYAVTYLKEGERKQIADGGIVCVGRDQFGYPVYEARKSSASWPRTVWNKRSHNASVYGSTLLRAIIPGRKFPFPKSLYAVEDTLRFFLTNRPNAVVLDFFSGSGTTAHAVMRLNRQDHGMRQSILITNNEVSSTEQNALRKLGLRPGDDDWEGLGICEYITKPRIEAVIAGVTPAGDPIRGGYKFTDPFPMSNGLEENAVFFTLTYESPTAINHELAFERIAPLLWMRAGSRGSSIDKLPELGWAVAETYGLITDLDFVTDFLAALGPTIRIAYIVTNDDRRFEAVSQRLPYGVEAVRLYESYLTNFEFVSGE